MGRKEYQTCKRELRLYVPVKWSAARRVKRIGVVGTVVDKVRMQILFVQLNLIFDVDLSIVSG